MLKEISGVHFGPDSMTWHALTESLSEAKEMVPEPGQDPQSIDCMFTPMSCITCTVNELGTFLDPQDQKLLDVLTDLWDSQLGSWEHRTRTQGRIYIENPWINIIAATTPSWIQHNLPEHMIGGGLTSRIIFVYANQKNRLIPFPSDLVRTEKYQLQRESLIHDLTIISEMSGSYTLSPDVKEWGEAQYENIWDPAKRPQHLASSRYDGYLARKQTHTFKTAMVIAAAKRDELVIKLEDVQQAEKALAFAERDMVKVFNSIGSSEENRNIITILGFLKNHGGKCAKVGLIRHCLTSMSMKQFKEAMDSGISGGYLKLYGKTGEDKNATEQYVHITKEGREKIE